MPWLALSAEAWDDTPGYLARLGVDGDHAASDVARKFVGAFHERQRGAPVCAV